MGIRESAMRLCDMISLTSSVNWNDSFKTALSILCGGRGHYRVVVTDDAYKVRGIISGRRALEVLLGRRGGSIRAKKGLKSLLKEPVSLFLDEAHQLFPENTTPQTILQYMAENALGYIIVVDQAGAFKGVVEEVAILSRLKGKVFNIKVEDVMSRNICAVSPNITVLDASNIMLDCRVRRLPVISPQGIIEGILTITDVLNHILKQEAYVKETLQDIDVTSALSDKVEDVMCSNVITVKQSCDVGEAIDKVLDNNVSGLPVVSEDGRVLGVVSRIDIVEKLVKAKGASAILEIMVK
ncbi:MAG: hypothetical protein DRJ31_05750 [Candidatus Methanomethylicota archaeon]|uniref:CBS domain-containing protein n=1 Tax=Thermoproteota archaeon TaxID=2056631 RepID=A0A497F0J2_9CREN|nr:MAG: hypothetical protein DRJ31_05750 [Candidatus Verstraetearchaeota archaeon]RLE52832.1 MAG: hypothetical protein DRJ33_02655 [Candidatus Verstraetearchaeota archaeon]